MSRSRRPQCSQGRDCGVCALSARSLSRVAKEHAQDDATRDDVEEALVERIEYVPGEDPYSDPWDFEMYIDDADLEAMDAYNRAAEERYRAAVEAENRNLFYGSAEA